MGRGSALRFHESECGIDRYPNFDSASWAPCVSDLSDATTAGSSCSTPTTNGDVLRRGAATDLMGEVGDALTARGIALMLGESRCGGRLRKMQEQKMQVSQ